MITTKPWMSSKVKNKLRAARYLQDTLWLVEIATDDDTANNALSLVERDCAEITERGLAWQSELIKKACGP